MISVGYIDTIDYQIIYGAINNIKTLIAINNSTIDPNTLNSIYKEVEIKRELLDETKKTELMQKYENLRGEELAEAIRNEIREKQDNLTGKMIYQGTTPRRLTDLIGSLCDLTSGSGDKGTPVVFIQGYFDNYAD